MESNKTLVAKGVTVTVGAEERVIDIYVNEHGNLILEGIGDVMYDMLGDELSFSGLETKPRANVRGLRL